MGIDNERPTELLKSFAICSRYWNKDDDEQYKFIFGIRDDPIYFNPERGSDEDEEEEYYETTDNGLPYAGDEEYVVDPPVIGNKSSPESIHTEESEYTIEIPQKPETTETFLDKFEEFAKRIDEVTRGTVHTLNLNDSKGRNFIDRHKLYKYTWYLHYYSTRVIKKHWGYGIIHLIAIDSMLNQTETVDYNAWFIKNKLFDNNMFITHTDAKLNKKWDRYRKKLNEIEAYNALLFNTNPSNTASIKAQYDKAVSELPKDMTPYPILTREKT